MFFDSWQEINRIFIVGLLAYITLIILLRVSGKRTLSKMNAFDLVVTVALGSILATILLNKNVSLAEGVAAFITLISLQYIAAWLSSRFDTVKNLIKSEPQLLFYQGRYLSEKIKKERILEAEILQAARSSGIPSMEKVEAVVLETDGSISVIKKGKENKDTLSNVINKAGGS